MDDTMKLFVKDPPEVYSQGDALVAEAKKDSQAFARLYDLYVQPVYRYLLSKIGNEQEAEDLTAQTFLAALQGLPRYKHRGNFAAWLFSIARNKLNDFYRQESRKRNLEEESLISMDRKWAQERIKTDRVLDLSKLLNSLPEEEQELLRLRFVTEMRFGEIASLLGKSEDAVKKSLYRLMARLQSQLEENHE